MIGEVAMSDLKRTPKRRVKKSSKRMWGMARLVLAVIFLIALIQQGYTLYSLHQEKQQLEQQLEDLKKENETLSEQKKLLEDNKHIESVAREELGLVKPGEVPYVR